MRFFVLIRLLLLLLAPVRHTCTEHSLASIQAQVTSSPESTLNKIEEALSIVNPHLVNLTRTWGPRCMNGLTNRVLDRSWTKENPLQHESQVVPWSVAVDALRYTKEVNPFFIRKTHQQCDTSPENLLQSVDSGELLCSLKLFNPSEICTILNKYSNIYWFGNSLTRHTIIGLLGLLSSNLHSINKYTKNDRYPQFEIPAEEALKVCQCDGQYSVHKTCISSYRLQDLSEGVVRACSDVLGEPFWEKSFHFQFYHTIQTKQLSLSSCVGSDDSRPIFLFFQGGNADVKVSGLNPRYFHRQTVKEFDVSSYFKRTISSFIFQYEKFYQNCPGGKLKPLHIAFSGVNAQEKQLDDSGDSSLKDDLLDLNERMIRYLRKWHPQIHVVNFFNMTQKNAADSADSYHYLSSINIQKAMTLIRLMNLISE